MGSGERKWLRWAVGAGLLLNAAGCSDTTGHGSGGDRPASDAQLRGAKTALMRADSCDDLLTKIQDDAIAKVDLALSRAKELYENGGGQEGHDGVGTNGADPTFDAPVGRPVAMTPTTAAPSGAGPAVGGGGVVSGIMGGGAVGNTGSGTSAGAPPPADVDVDESSEAAPPGAQAPSNTSGDSKEPTGASDTNTQVEGVDEADFIKLVDSGKGMFLLHNNTLLKLKTYPAEQLSLEPPQLKVEGSPSELFVTDDGRAVIFSSVYYSFGNRSGGGETEPSPAFCGPGFCGGKGGYYGGNATKITIADVSGSTLTTLRELYYQGGYVSSRRYDDVVRVVLQGASSYSGLFEPEADVSDPWGRPFPKEEVFSQLEQWRDRVAASIRNTVLSDWVPQAKEAKGGKLVDVAPDCDSYFVPQPGLAQNGLVHVLALDTSKPEGDVGGVTILGQASTVYSNLDRLVLAQPDYRWMSGNGVGDLGFIPEQRTSLHVFGLSGDKTEYLASGWVRGHLPTNNPQFGVDVTEDHTLRVATSGQVRLKPDAEPGDADFWQTDTDNRVSTLQQKGPELALVGTSDKLGHTREIVRSARFVGDRAYVVTAVQTDPLIVLDVGDPAKLTLLGEIQIPGFSTYVHPLDDNHLITFGDSGSRGSQLQLFDVTDPQHIPPPKVLDFGGGSASEVANNHKAFTFYAPQSLIALPVSGSRMQNGSYSYMAALRVIRVNADTGFELLGTVDHSTLYANQGCFQCGSWGCESLCVDYGGSPIRRGQFVENADATYVYAIGSAAVSVSDVADLSKSIVEVKLPQLPFDPSPWYANGDSSAPSAGTGSRGASAGGVILLPVQPPATTPGTGATPVTMPGTAPSPGTTTLPVDAGSAVPAADAGAAADGGAAVADAGIEANEP